jgi:GNAT superfamily N-acetyltransferase
MQLAGGTGVAYLARMWIGRPGAAANDLTIRHATSGDLDVMARLLGDLFSIETDFRVDGVRQRRGLAMLLGDPRATVLVATRASAVVGMATVQLVVSTSEGDLSALVEDVVVERSERRRGVGRRLLEACEEWARSRDATRMQLLTDRGNTTALAFFERTGWAPTRLVCLRRARPR